MRATKVLAALLCGVFAVLSLANAADAGSTAGTELKAAAGCPCGCYLRNPFSGVCVQCKPRQLCRFDGVAVTAEHRTDAAPTWRTPVTVPRPLGRHLLQLIKLPKGISINSVTEPIKKGGRDFDKVVRKAGNDIQAEVKRGADRVVSSGTTGATFTPDPDRVERVADQVGDVVDQARAAAADPSGFIRNTLINGAKDFISNELEEALSISNVCYTQTVKDTFSEHGAWKAYYGRRLWKGRIAGLGAGLLFPGTSSFAAAEIMSELKAQVDSTSGLLERAVADAGGDLLNLLDSMIANIKNSALRGVFVYPKIDRDTFGLKAAILEVTCSTTAAGIKLPAEGYYQVAIAYRTKTPAMQKAAEISVAGLAAAAEVASADPRCTCTNVDKIPFTQIKIPCGCYFHNQGVANACAGAKYNQQVRMWYRDC